MANINSTDSATNLTQNSDKSLAEALAVPKIAITSILLLCLMVLIILGNAMVIRTVYMTSKLHYPAFYFVVSLAVADFLVGFLVPVSLVYNITSEMTGRWLAGEIACDFWTFANIWFVCASLLNLCVVSWDRYVAVTSPFTYKFAMRGRKVKVFITVVWSVSLVAAILYTLAFKYSKERRLCITNGLPLQKTVFAFIIIYAVPTLFLIFVNGRVLQIARKHRLHIQSHEITISNLSIAQPHDGNKNKRKNIIKNEIKTFRTFMIVIGTFVICWTPFFVLLVLQHVVTLPSKLPHVAVILFYVKSGLNPLIYGSHNRELRKAAANSLKKRRRIASNVSESDPNDLPNDQRGSASPMQNDLRGSVIPTPNVPNDQRGSVSMPNDQEGSVSSMPNVPNDQRESIIQIPNDQRRSVSPMPDVPNDQEGSVSSMPNVPNDQRESIIQIPNDQRRSVSPMPDVPNDQRGSVRPIPNELRQSDLIPNKADNRTIYPLQIDDILTSSS